MIIKSAELETVCGITSTLPETEMPEIAFSGKSNVGKSSLINGLLNRKSLARTSSQPIKRWKIISDQCTDEPQILRENFSTAWKDTDDQLL